MRSIEGEIHEERLFAVVVDGVFDESDSIVSEAIGDVVVRGERGLVATGPGGGIETGIGIGGDEVFDEGGITLQSASSDACREVTGRAAIESVKIIEALPGWNAATGAEMPLADGVGLVVGGF